DREATGRRADRKREGEAGTGGEDNQAALDHQCRGGHWPTVTVTSADRPARMLTSAGGLTQAMRTGTRCTTLTKLPVALWAGSSENAPPGPPASPPPLP